ncbi:MAG: RNA polymerase sigma factor [Planctomycetales bacterium]|nr:RNA polymerase sigma factor [Planctomycetales bacterium]
MLDFDEIELAWQQYSSRLLIVLRPLGGTDAEDAVQEAFIALSQLDSLPTNPMAWLIKVARNRVIQWQRSDQRRSARHAGRRTSEYFVAPSHEKALDQFEVAAALKQLPIEQAEIITMHIWGQLSFEDIATVVGKSRSSTHRVYAQALKQLRGILSGVHPHE